MLSSTESIALSVALAFLNAVLHYVLYRIAVSLILFVKGLIYWFFTSSQTSIVTRPKTTTICKREDRRRSASRTNLMDFDSDYGADG